MRASSPGRTLSALPAPLLAQSSRRLSRPPAGPAPCTPPQPVGQAPRTQPPNVATLPLKLRSLPCCCLLPSVPCEAPGLRCDHCRPSPTLDPKAGSLPHRTGLGCRKPGTLSPSQAQPLLLSDRAPKTEGRGPPQNRGLPSAIIHLGSSPGPGSGTPPDLLSLPITPDVTLLGVGQPSRRPPCVLSLRAGTEGRGQHPSGQRCHRRPPSRPAGPLLPQPQQHRLPPDPGPWQPPKWDPQHHGGLASPPPARGQHTSVLSPLRVPQGLGSPQHLPKSLSGGPQLGQSKERPPSPSRASSCLRGIQDASAGERGRALSALTTLPAAAAAGWAVVYFFNSFTEELAAPRTGSCTWSGN